ncbi:OTU domain-containing protein 4-like isoform X4 [Copidosoma floridanum]|uniref:OTU domain-containing protein 4-like isoform X4 n=1 Tax=Copidosoma floridanum TaxID=29053 RepID=UPI000C6F6E0D|nr:OTU domain-containing protein 4-like isoform X4 [Copidosoma floridanum]
MYRNNNLPRYMDPRKTPKRMIEPVDEWLQNEGFYRKHGPKDPTCLFRAIAEQVYHNQRSHLRVREECVEYIRDNKQLFQEKTMIPVGSYCDQMACVTEWGGENEILAMSLLYQKNVVIFDGHKLTKKVAIDNRRQENFLLCFMPPKQYETVYNQEHTAIAGFCQYQKWKKPWNGGPNRRTKDQVPNDGNNEKNLNNSKSVAKNTVNKTEDTENQPRIPNENRVALKDYNIKDQVENLKNTLESTHISVESVEPRISDKKSKINVNNQQNEHSSQKQITTSINHEDNSSNQQNYQRADNNDTFYPPYAGSAFQPIPRFPADSEIVSYDATKTYEIKANEAPSDPANGRQFYNVGVKYYWSQNMWPNGTNGPSFNDNTFFFAHPAPDPNNYSFVVNGPVPCSDNIVQQANNYQHNNQHVRHNNRSSPPRHRDQDQNTNIPRPAGQRMNYHYRNPDFRNLTHNPNIDNRIRNDGKNNNPNEQPQQNGNKDMQRVNKSNGMAPRFKKNYEGGKYRNDHNPQYQYRQQQHQPDYDIRKRKQIDMQTMQNRCDMINDPAQQHQLLQPINAMLHQQQPNHLPQQQSTMIQSQSPPPLNGPYPYSMTYNQVPYVPLGPYPPEPETFSGPYYSPPPGYIQVPYLPASELPTSEQTVYQPVEFPAQYPPVFSQYIYPPPAAMYPTQPPPPDSCYPPFPGQPYFLPYASPLPPPGMQPPNLTSPPTLQSAQ